MACAKLNDLEGHFQRVRRYLRHSMLDPNLLPGVFVHASEYVGGLVNRRTVELLLDGKINALTLKNRRKLMHGNTDQWVTAC